jgi:hypothetical protein
MQSGQVIIGHAESECLSIEIVSHEPDDWRVTNVEVVCGTWKGTFRWQFYKGELRRFGQEIQQLYRTLSGAANLVPMEPNLKLKVTGDGRGHITVEGRAEPEFYSGTYLVFTLSLDQTELPHIVAALLAIDPA